MKKLVFLLCFIISTASIAQRDIDHWQLSVIGGGFYFSETVSNTLNDIEEPGYYSLGVRLQKRLGTDFQIGLSLIENRFREDFDSGVRNTSLSFAYNWDNGYLFSQRAIVAPYHLLAAGLRARSTDSEVNLESTTGVVSLENGFKVRLGDDWSTQVAFVYNWNSDNESFKNVFNSENSYGVRIGLSYHFGQVQTNYQGPVFNAGRSYGGSEMAYYDFSSKPVYLALNGKIAGEIAYDPLITVETDVAKRGVEVMSSDGITSTIFQNDSLFRLIGKDDQLDSLYQNRGDLVKISMASLNSLKQASNSSSKSDMRFAEDEKGFSENEKNLIDRQNRLIENQNDFIRMLLYGEQKDSLGRDLDNQLDTNYVSVNKGYWKEPNPADTAKFYTEEDSAALARVTSIDSAHVTQWDKEVLENDSLYSESKARDTDRVNAQEDTKKNGKGDEARESNSEKGQDESALNELRDRVDQLEEENRRLREDSEVESTVSSESVRTLSEETKRRNDLMEEQITATQKLAEKSAEPTEVVIDDNRRNSRGGVNLQPGLVVPIGGGGNKKNDKEVLENQEQMQARLDSMSSEISELKKSQRTQNNVLVTQNRGAVDSILSDTTGFDLPVDTVKISEEQGSVDTLIQHENYGVDKLNLSELQMELNDSILVDTNSVEIADSSKGNVRAIEITDSQTIAVGSKNDYLVSVYFALNSSTVSDKDQEMLKMVLEDLQKMSEQKLVLEGHTDNSGNAAYNQMLSKKRADAVRAYFIENGIVSERIEIKPLGSEQAESQYNESSRRVDISLK